MGILDPGTPAVTGRDPSGTLSWDPPVPGSRRGPGRGALLRANGVLCIWYDGRDP